jgi:hypothetical protein
LAAVGKQRLSSISIRKATPPRASALRAMTAKSVPTMC